MPAQLKEHRCVTRLMSPNSSQPWLDLSTGPVLHSESYSRSSISGCWEQTSSAVMQSNAVLKAVWSHAAWLGLKHGWNTDFFIWNKVKQYRKLKRTLNQMAVLDRVSHCHVCAFPLLMACCWKEPCVTFRLLQGGHFLVIELTVYYENIK